MTDRLPEGWELAAVEDFSQTATGGTPSRKRSEYYGGDIPWVKSGDLNDGLITSVDESITELGLSSSNAKMFPRGAVCIALYGATVGKLGILDIDAATNQAVCGIFPEQGVNASYVFHALRNERSNLILQAQGGAQPNISNGIVKTTQLRLAPLAEQRRIVAKIEALQERSRKARELLTEVGPLLVQFRQSLLAAAFRGDLTADWREQNPNVESGTELLARIREERRERWEEAELAKYKAKGKQPPKGWQDKYQEPKPLSDAVLPDLPESWCWASLDELVVGDRKVSYGVLKPGPHVPDGVRFIKSGQVRDGFLDLSEDFRISHKLDEQYAKTRLQGGEVLLNLVGASIGRSAVAPPELANANVTRAIAVIPTPPDWAAWLQLALQGPLGQRLLHATVGGSAQPVLNLSDVRRLAIPLVPPDEAAVIQARIQEGVERIRALEEFASESEPALTQLEQSILAKAFQGELVPQDPNDEPASVLLERIREHRFQQREKTKGKGKKTTRSPKRNTAMTKSRFDDDVKGQPYLTKLMLASTGKSTLTAEELFQIAQLPLPDFYKQLDFEVTQQMLVEREGRLEPADAT